MNKKIIKALYKKEIVDILRDKKTLLMMIIIPLVLYPLLCVGSMAIVSNMANSDVNDVFDVAIEDYDDAHAEKMKDYISKTGDKFKYSFVFVTSYQDNKDGDSLEDRTFEEAMKDGVIDAYISHVKTADDKEKYEIVYLSSNTESATAADMLAKVLDEYKKDKSKEIVLLNGLDPKTVFESVEYKNKDMSSTEETVGTLFGYIIPFLLISSVLMGAMYPAIDATAGEKERGTLETLLTLPVKNIELIVSKFLATSTIASAAAFLNVFSMGVLGIYFFESMKASSDTAIEFSIASYIPAIALTLVCAIVFAMFSSAVCLFVCIFAGSFKEAQNYSTPVLLVFMLAGMAGILPSVELNNVTMLIPVVNTSLLIGKLFAFEFNMSVIATVIISNIAYCLIFVVFMANAFDSEKILFSDGSDSIKIIEGRNSMKEKQIPAVGDILLLFSLLILVLIMAGSVLIVKWGIYGLIGEQLLIFLCTALYNWYIKTDFKEVFSLNKPKVSDIAGAIISIAGLFIFMILISIPLSLIFKESADTVNESFAYIWEDKPVWMLILSSAVLPAICEEFAFRGFLFGSLSHRFKPATAIIWTGLIFGLYHMSLVKLLVVGVLGCYLAFVVYKTKSIYVSMFMHCINNTLAVLMSVKGDILKNVFPFLYDDLSAQSLIFMAIFSVVALAVGTIIFNAGHKKTLA